jgi:HSP20 family protein
MTQTLPVKVTKSIFEEIDRLHDRITKRAYDIFNRNGEGFGKALDDWLKAERELLWKPSIELQEKDGEFTLCIAVPGVDPKTLDIEVTPREILVKANLKHEHKEEKGTVHICEFASGDLFRSVHFPKSIAPDKVKAEFKNGMLIITAAIAKEEQARKVKIEAA